MSPNCGPFGQHIHPIISEAHITRGSLHKTLSTAHLDAPVGLYSGKYHTIKECSNIAPDNATTGVIRFPLCADCARYSKERIITITLQELALTANAGAWHWVPQQERDELLLLPEIS